VLTWTLGAVLVPTIVSAAVALAIMGGAVDRLQLGRTLPTPTPQSDPQQVYAWAVYALEALDGPGEVIDLTAPPDATAPRDALAAAEAAPPSIQLQRAANTNGEAAIAYERARQETATARAKAFAEMDTYLARYGLSRQTLNEVIAQRSADATRGPLPPTAAPTFTPDSVATATADAVATVDASAANTATAQAAPVTTATAEAVSTETARAAVAVVGTADAVGTETAIADATVAPGKTATAQVVRMANATMEAAPAATEQAVMLSDKAISAANELAYALRNEARIPSLYYDNAVYAVASASAEAEVNTSPQGQALRELLEPARRAIESRDPTELARVAVSLERIG